jgi:hypothetical protein
MDQRADLPEMGMAARRTAEMLDWNKYRTELRAKVFTALTAISRPLPFVSLCHPLPTR